MSTSWRMSWMLLQGQLMRGRKARGFTQTELATSLGVSASTFKRWELGHAVPDATQLFRWADRLGVSITSSIAESSNSDTSEAAA